MEIQLSRGLQNPDTKLNGPGLKGPTITRVIRVSQDLRANSFFVVEFETDEAAGSAQYLTGWSKRGARCLEAPYYGGLLKTNEPGAAPQYYESIQLVEGRSRSEFLASTRNVVRATYALQTAIRGLGLKL